MLEPVIKTRQGRWGGLYEYIFVKRFSVGSTGREELVVQDRWLLKDRNRFGSTNTDSPEANLSPLFSLTPDTSSWGSCKALPYVCCDTHQTWSMRRWRERESCLALGCSPGLWVSWPIRQTHPGRGVSPHGFPCLLSPVQPSTKVLTRY